ncbi:MAG: hypothetical protein KC917_06940 [Candidatus Omnitrophica bacterium]|nr:hypothetical protein [Candidatus Omnitrophota bacterium]MCA9415986.1 hypothetical protein [Candidatus Omnitrophota bacterium]MCA9425279.1 hypothetical protein [Candidatus Omnitrophota bacterium]MCA9432875.1 hypothetical protein [Candidatus Omnitrophota bacterium]MCA9437380.1 hypothetical protein [Candidatus Omnitrophota bacterium]
MPIGRLHKSYDEGLRQRLKQSLVDEWRNPHSDTLQPLIAEEGGGPGQPIHLYIIWDEWAYLDAQDRSEIIMDAYQEVSSPEKVLEVTLAMGMTREEAERMGLRIESVE